MKKKLAALLIASALFTATVSALVSCQEDTAVNPSHGTGNSEFVSDETDEKGEIVLNSHNVLNLFEREDFEMKTFHVLCASNFNSTICVPQSPNFEEFASVDIVNDALITRHYLLEDYFNIKIDYTVAADDNDVCTILKNNASTDDDLYEMALGSLAQVAYPMAMNGAVINLNELDEIDFTRDWWNKNTLTDLCINDKVYFATGDISNRSVTAIQGYVFNMNLMDRYNIDYPYQYVRDGAWTLDVMQQMFKDISEDLNHDEKYSIKDDIIPVVTTGYVNYIAAGGRIVERDEDGMLTCVFDRQKEIDIMSQVLEKLTGQDILMNVGYDGIDAFKENRTMFMNLAGCDLALLRDMNDNYGFVVCPKLNEAQDSYITPGNYWISTCAMIPSNVRDENLHFAAQITEAMAAVSRYTSIVAKYDILLMEKELRDEESKYNAQLAAETMSFDIGKLTDLGGISSALEDAFKNKNNFVSRYAAIKDKAVDQLNDIIDALG